MIALLSAAAILSMRNDDTIRNAPDDHLLVSLAMLSPFSPGEKQSLLECTDLAQLAAMMTALFELTAGNRQSTDRIMH